MVVFRNTTHHLPEGLSSLYILFRSAIIGPRVNAKAFMLGQHIWCIQYLMRNIIWVSVYVCMCACISRGSTEQRPWAKAVTAGQRLRWILGDIFASRILVTMRFCCSLCDFLVRSFFVYLLVLCVYGCAKTSTFEPKRSRLACAYLCCILILPSYARRPTHTGGSSTAQLTFIHNIMNHALKHLSWCVCREFVLYLLVWSHCNRSFKPFSRLICSMPCSWCLHSLLKHTDYYCV